MITNVSLVSVWVTDLDAALDFYVDTLGFEARDDVTLGADFRWVTVGHPSQPELDLHLTTPSSPLSEDLIAAMRRAQRFSGATPSAASTPGPAAMTSLPLAACG